MRLLDRFGVLAPANRSFRAGKAALGFRGALLLSVGIAGSSLAGIGGVDYSTGNLNLSIPLMQVSGRKLSYAVTLDYSSAIKRGQPLMWRDASNKGPLRGHA